MNRPVILLPAKTAVLSRSGDTLYLAPRNERTFPSIQRVQDIRGLTALHNQVTVARGTMVLVALSLICRHSKTASDISPLLARVVGGGGGRASPASGCLLHSPLLLFVISVCWTRSVKRIPLRPCALLEPAGSLVRSTMAQVPFNRIIRLAVMGCIHYGLFRVKNQYFSSRDGGSPALEAEYLRIQKRNSRLYRELQPHAGQHHVVSNRKPTFSATSAGGWIYIERGMAGEGRGSCARSLLQPGAVLKTFVSVSLCALLPTRAECFCNNFYSTGPSLVSAAPVRPCGLPKHSYVGRRAPRTENPGREKLFISCRQPQNETQFRPILVKKHLQCTSMLVQHTGIPSTGSFPAESSDFDKWISCRTMPLAGGFSRVSAVFPALSFRHCSILTSITFIGSQDLTVKSRPNLLTHPSLRVTLQNIES
ncbi:hypothetical protein PR048_017278 [Dryococelus australis]|uniref:Uncharacterized protein n=1 Tax=Dryococelus australis TaxID=614101 RepID=A0ABQ9H943_9NEOP|nr:hypothetical protein PR048_017278 [Dryococelus australis]